MSSHHRYHFQGYYDKKGNCLLFLDSQDPKHIKQAHELIDAWETVISWNYRHSLYALGCNASRARRMERALDCIVREVEDGQSISKRFGIVRDLSHYEGRMIFTF